jgi:hypothetical protein
MWEAELAVKEYNCNAHIRSFFTMFPHLPMQHDLPITQFKFDSIDFSNYNPSTPDEETWRIFFGAPHNIIFNGITYAANCRHPTLDWDEHPWCINCIRSNNIVPCRDPDDHSPPDHELGEGPCYICERMSRDQVMRFLEALNTGKPIIQASPPLPPQIRCQIDADLSMSEDMTPVFPNHWETLSIGWIRPSNLFPIFHTVEMFHINSKSSIKKSIIEDRKIYLENYQRNV